jgi:hypothetical protein
MLEMVEARRDGDRVEQSYDLFSGLLDAAQDELDNGAALSEEELIGEYNIDYCIIEKRPDRISGNMFIFLLAGHDVGSSPSFGIMT